MWRKVWIISLKHAVNALLTNGALMGLMPHTFNFHSLIPFLKLTLGVVIGRETMVWLPKIIAWSEDFTGLNGKNGNANGKANAAQGGQ